MPGLPPLRVLSPTAILGYGFPTASFEAGLALNPDVIAVDAGSSDPGPYYLGAGVSFTDRAAVKRDLRHMLIAGRARGIPVLVGSAGGAGARPHLDWTVDIIREIAREDGLKGRLAVIPSDMDKGALLAALTKGDLVALPPGGPATPADIEDSTHIVAQIGEDPLIAALRAGADVVVAGRCYDPSVFAALPILRGYPRGLALHMGKILECAAIAALPGSGSDCMMATLDDTGFVLETLNPARICTVTSVAAHTLYEKSDPYHLPGPGGALNLTGTDFAQLDPARVRVTGSVFEPSDGYFVKLEAAHGGERTPRAERHAAERLDRRADAFGRLDHGAAVAAGDQLLRHALQRVQAGQGVVEAELDEAPSGVVGAAAAAGVTHDPIGGLAGDRQPAQQET